VLPLLISGTVAVMLTAVLLTGGRVLVGERPRADPRHG
jgi:hypothetical protein